MRGKSPSRLVHGRLHLVTIDGEVLDRDTLLAALMARCDGPTCTKRRCFASSPFSSLSRRTNILGSVGTRIHVIRRAGAVLREESLVMQQIWPSHGARLDDREVEELYRYPDRAWL